MDHQWLERFFKELKKALSNLLKLVFNIFKVVRAVYKLVGSGSKDPTTARSNKRPADGTRPAAQRMQPAASLETPRQAMPGVEVVEVVVPRTPMRFRAPTAAPTPIAARELNGNFVPIAMDEQRAAGPQQRPGHVTATLLAGKDPARPVLGKDQPAGNVGRGRAIRRPTSLP